MVALRQKIPGAGRRRNATGYRFRDETCCCTLTCAELVSSVSDLRAEVTYADPLWTTPPGGSCTNCADAGGTVLFDFAPTFGAPSTFTWSVTEDCLTWFFRLVCPSNDPLGLNFMYADIKNSGFPSTGQVIWRTDFPTPLFGLALDVPQDIPFANYNSGSNCLVGPGTVASSSATVYLG